MAKQQNAPLPATKPGKGNAKPKPTSGAKVAHKQNPLNSYFSNHLKVIKSTIQDQRERPLAAFFTCSVIGVTFVLPVLLAILLANAQSINRGWDGSAQITLVLKQEVPALDAGVLAREIAKRSSIEASRFIDKAAALEEFKEQFALEDAIDYLDENPLPHVILVKPDKSLNNIDLMTNIKDSLESLAEVESALLDVIWVQRLQSMTEVLLKAVWLVAIMLAIAIVLILGNTIRLAIENRKEEIAVVKLVGGTDSFVRRPFLYMGAFFGLGGGLISLILINFILFVLEEPIHELARSYQSNFNLSGLNFESTLFLLILGMVLGWFGSWLAVRKHLDAIQPT